MEHTYMVVSLTALLLTVLCGVLGLPLLRKMNARQEIREEGPQSHQAKSGTPTMGGIFILISLTATVLFYEGFRSEILWLLFLVLGHGVLGLMDDGIKTVMKRNLGLTARQKIIGQIVLATIFIYGTVEYLNLSTTLHIPFINHYWELGLFYYLFALVVIVGATNAVNLTDGLDGLAAGTVAIAAAAYVWVARGAGQPEVGTFAAALAGTAIGFLVFNYNPAKMFMGDTGSLALGGGFAGMALLTKSELLLVIIGGIFVAEAISVILQVASFKLTGQRIFRMSPLHHHFELGGWSETRVVHTFWIAGLILAFIGIWGC